MSDSVLKSYLVKLGFTVDESGQKKLLDSMEKINKGTIGLVKNFAQLGASLAATGTAAAVGLEKIAKPMVSLFYAAQLTKGTVSDLKTLQLAFGQIGISAEEAQSAIMAFSAARRLNPYAMTTQFGAYGYKEGDSDEKNFLRIQESIANAEKAGKINHNYAATLSKQAGGSEEFLAKFEANQNDFNTKFLPLAAKLVSKFPVNQTAKTDVDYDRKFQLAAANTDLTLGKAAAGQMPAAEKALDVAQKLEDTYTKIDDKTGGWLSHIVTIAGLSEGILKSWKAISWLRGLGGGASAAEGAGAAAGAGGTLAATAGAIAEMIPDIGAAYIGSHFLDKATKGTFWDTDQAAAPGQKETGLKDQLAGLNKSLASFVAGFEGHAKAGYGTYKDIAGHLTAGYGHLVQKGEDFSKLDKQGALSLLSKDLQSAGESVKSLVKVALSGNQLKALTSFVFNEGASAFKNSTLLKDINAGNTGAIGADLARFNKIHQGTHLVANEGLTRRRAAEAELYATPDKTITNNIKTDIHIQSTDPKAAAAESARAQNGVHDNVVRNLQGGIS